MASIVQAACGTCGHHWHATEYGYAFGLFSGTFPADFAWRTCPRCLLGVVTPTVADRASWMRWRGTTARGDCGLTPFAGQIISRIEAQLPWNGSEAAINLGEFDCPKCRHRLECNSGDYKAWAIFCPKCGARSGKVVGVDHEGEVGEAHPY
jgi:hypothetical protein